MDNLDKNCGERKSGEVQINATKIKENFKNFFKNKKLIWIIIFILLIATLILGTWIRIQNIPLLKNSVTGDEMPPDIDTFYFLRISETILEQGKLSEYDPMRVFPPTPYTKEIMPWVVVYLYKLSNVLGDYNLQQINIISPVIFFILGGITFFFLVYVLTRSKIAALISSIFLAVIPTYLYRTMPGVSDHETIGMVAFFLILTFFTLALR